MAAEATTGALEGFVGAAAARSEATAQRKRLRSRACYLKRCSTTSPDIDPHPKYKTRARWRTQLRSSSWLDKPSARKCVRNKKIRRRTDSCSHHQRALPVKSFSVLSPEHPQSTNGTDPEVMSMRETPSAVGNPWASLEAGGTDCGAVALFFCLKWPSGPGGGCVYVWFVYLVLHLVLMPYNILWSIKKLAKPSRYCLS